MYGGFASGRNSIAIGSYEKTTDQNKNNYCTATNRNSISIGAKVFNSGFFATALGYDVEIGRYRVYRGNT
ncbi:hypothetical protein [Lachnospira sp.]|jgi:hypothetical protein|uniref:hypothetical protein n=1 Tax=Lachnospira sp. TaxID=2049031 RepID=UPI00257A99A3|nr:hypothetical protein [Lachnospira sp.]